MAVDLSVFQRQKSLTDLQNEFQARKQAEALNNLQVQALVQKTQEVDATKLGENAFIKAAQGLPLSPQELGAARLLDAKSGGIQFDPVNGGLVQKPRISDKIGFDSMSPQAQSQGQSSLPVMPNLNPDPFSSPIPNAPAAMNTPSDPFEQRFQEQFKAAAGNRKLQQQLQESYAKSRISPTESQAQASGYANRVLTDEPILGDPNTVKALSSPWQKTLNALPGGNYLVSDEFQSGNQAQRDFINALLRRESGAAIAPSEFDNARQQYFPQPGDSPETVAQKAANRQTAAQGIQFSAGPSFIPPAMPTQQNLTPADVPKKGIVQDGYMFLGGDPSQPSSWKKK